MCAALCAALPAYADNREEAGEAIQRGKEFLDAGEYREAITRFEIALKLDPELTSPYAGMGFAYQALTEYRPAIDAFTTYLDKNPDGASAAEVRAALMECKARYFVSIQISSRPSGAEVLINGEPRGVTPIQFETLEPGEYRVELRLEKYQPNTSTLTAAPGQRYILPEVGLLPTTSPRPRLWIGAMLQPFQAPLRGDVDDSVDLVRQLNMNGMFQLNNSRFALGGAVIIERTADVEFQEIRLAAVQPMLELHFLQPFTRSQRERLDFLIASGFRFGNEDSGTVLRLGAGLLLPFSDRWQASLQPLAFDLIATGGEVKLNGMLLVTGLSRGFQ